MQINDTMGTGVVLVAGSRLLGGSVSIAGGTGGQVFDVGIRDFTTKVAIDQTAIANGQAVNTGGVFTLNNGTKIANGIDYVTPQDCEVYITNRGAAGSAGQLFVLRTPYLGA